MPVSTNTVASTRLALFGRSLPLAVEIRFRWVHHHQQYAKNLRLTQAAIEAGGEATEQTRDAPTERSWKRKIAEAHLATLIEKTTSKEDILTGYLNVGYFGSGAYGVQSAARRYYPLMQPS